ncbi:MAG: hypothetical protein HZC01_03970 [Candidatus Kerfeldbacteria bacterium]|nr:hypothetical protein [Candidatus Kerfeldbacteria bacterium]
MHLVVSKFPGKNHSLTVPSANVLINRALPNGTIKIAITPDQRQIIESHTNRTVDIARERFNQPPTSHQGRIVDFHEMAGTLFAELQIG